MKKTPVSLRLDPELLARLDRTAEDRGQTRTQLLIGALRTALEHDLGPQRETVALTATSMETAVPPRHRAGKPVGGAAAVAVPVTNCAECGALQPGNHQRWCKRRHAR